MVEHLVGIVFGTGTRLTLELAGGGQNLVGLLLGDADDLLLARDGHSLRTGIFDHAVRFGLGVVEQTLALTHDLTRLRELAAQGVETVLLFWSAV